ELALSLQVPDTDDHLSAANGQGKQTVGAVSHSYRRDRIGVSWEGMKFPRLVGCARRRLFLRALVWRPLCSQGLITRGAHAGNDQCRNYQHKRRDLKLGHEHGFK